MPHALGARLQLYGEQRQLPILGQELGHARDVLVGVPHHLHMRAPNHLTNFMLHREKARTPTIALMAFETQSNRAWLGPP